MISEPRSSQAPENEICGRGAHQDLRSNCRFLFLFGLVTNCRGYSVLTHEAIVDTAWESAIKPLLLDRFPNATLGRTADGPWLRIWRSRDSRHGLLPVRQ